MRFRVGIRQQRASPARWSMIQGTVQQNRVQKGLTGRCGECRENLAFAILYNISYVRTVRILDCLGYLKSDEKSWTALSPETATNTPRGGGARSHPGDAADNTFMAPPKIPQNTLKRLQITMIQ